MPRELKDLLQDIISAAQAIETNTSGLGYDEFIADNNRVKAVLFDLSVIGEACRTIPDEIREKRPEVEWGKIVGLRHFISHVYWTIKVEKIWDIVQDDVPELRREIQTLLDELNEQP